MKIIPDSASKSKSCAVVPAWVHDKKSSLLASTCTEINPYDYFKAILAPAIGHDAPHPYMTIRRTRDKKSHLARDIEHLTRLCRLADDIAAPLCTFYKCWRSTATLHQVCAFAVDIERLVYDDLQRVLQLMQRDEIRPAYIVNSGGGAHLVYAMTPADAWDWRKPALAAVQEQLKAVWAKRGFAVDPVPTMIQPYRVPGSRTKSGHYCGVYATGAGHTTIERLGGWLNVDTGVVREGVIDPKKKRMGRREMRKANNIKLLPNAKRGFYERMIDQLLGYKVPQPGRRWYAMMALACVAYKCRVPRAEVEQQIANFALIFNAKEGAEPFTDDDIAAAIKAGYRNQSVDITRETLNEWAGTDFQPAKRNGRTQAVHLEMARAKKSALVPLDIKDRLNRLLKKQPDVSKSHAAKLLNLSRPTVHKYWPK